MLRPRSFGGDSILVRKSMYGVVGSFYMSCFVDVYHSRTMMCRHYSPRLVVSVLRSTSVSLLIQDAEGSYHMPSYLPSDARGLINAMLAVDPVKRITIPEITQHPFFTTDLPRYLTPLPPPGPVLGTLSSLVIAPKVIDFEIIDGLGRIEEDIVDELTTRMEGVEREDVWECLRRDDGVQGNAVKVAYLLLRDKRRLGRDCKFYGAASRFAVLTICSGRVRGTGAGCSTSYHGCAFTALSNFSLSLLTHSPWQPRNTVSPNALSPGGGDNEENPFEAEFNGDDDDDADSIDDGLDFSTPPITESEINNFAVLNSSLPEQLPEPHHLASYATAKRSTPVEKKEKKQHRTKWHFGIRSRSPPMEVMLEIYRTLKALGMEWKEKKNLGGLGGITAPGRKGEGKIERASEWDGAGHVDLKAAAGIYFVETRARVEDVVVSYSPIWQPA
jgi:carbon catabolite-derepressing protein kinase